MQYLPTVLEIRKKRGVSVKKLADLTGIPKERIYKWEAGTGNPKAQDSQKLEQWLTGVEVIQASQEAEITQDRYLKLLEDNDKFFKNLIKTNLGTAEVVQAAILAHLKAMVQADAEEKSGGDKRKQERMLSAWNRRIAENLGLLERKDSYSTVDR